MYVAVIKDVDSGEVVGVLPLAAKVFKTGSRGLYGSAKLTIGGEVHQCQVQAVVVHSKDAGRGPE